VQIEEKYPEINKLIQLGKERGFIMYEELFDNLPEEVTGIAEELDDIYVRLGELDIEVVEGESGEADGRGSTQGASEAKKGEEKQAAKTEQRPATEQLEKTNDPVRMYLREMGTVKLLDREGEVEIAQRIEAGEARVFIALSRRRPKHPSPVPTDQRAGPAGAPRCARAASGRRCRARREGRRARPGDSPKLFRHDRRAGPTSPRS
jgi:hypothetical protein